MQQTINSILTVVPVNQAQEHPLQRHAAPAIVAALDAQFPAIPSVLQCLSAAPLPVFHCINKSTV